MICGSRSWLEGALTVGFQDMKGSNAVTAKTGRDCPIAGSLTFGKVRGRREPIVAGASDERSCVKRNSVLPSAIASVGGIPPYVGAKGKQGDQMKSSTSADHRAPRIPLMQKAKLITSDGDQMDVVVMDVSVGGFRLKADETFYDGENIVTGETVTLQVERGNDLSAKIVWVTGCEAGGVFLGPSNPS